MKKNLPYLLKIRGGREVDSYGKKAGKGALISEDASMTLGTSQDQYLFQPFGFDEYNQQVTGDKSHTLSAAAGMSGNHRHIVIEPYNQITDRHILDDQGGRQISVRKDGTSPTLRAETHGNIPCVLARTLSGDTCGTLDASYYKGACNRSGKEREVDFQQDHDTQTYIVRRLTPLECCRLQGFPDYWCEGLDNKDPSAEEVRKWIDIFDEYNRATGKPNAKKKTEKQIRKWLANPYSDSAMYKMWGNGVALPCVAFIMQSIKNQYKEDING